VRELRLFEGTAVKGNRARLLAASKGHSTMQAPQRG
jgi:hypothetical protein